MTAMTLAEGIKAYLNSLAIETLVSLFVRKVLQKDVKPLSAHVHYLQHCVDGTR